MSYHALDKHRNFKSQATKRPATPAHHHFDAGNPTSLLFARSPRLFKARQSPRPFRYASCFVLRRHGHRRLENPIPLPRGAGRGQGSRSHHPDWQSEEPGNGNALRTSRAVDVLVGSIRESVGGAPWQVAARELFLVMSTPETRNRTTAGGAPGVRRVRPLAAGG